MPKIKIEVNGNELLVDSSTLVETLGERLKAFIRREDGSVTLLLKTVESQSDADKGTVQHLLSEKDIETDERLNKLMADMMHEDNF